MSFLHNAPAFVIAQTAIGHMFKWCGAFKRPAVKCLNVRFDVETGFSYYLLAGEKAWTRSDLLYEAERTGV